jgi:hypothetical protein
VGARVAITMPGGVQSDGTRRRDAELRPLRGEDELFLAEEGASLLPAARTTALLTRCLVRLGPCEPVSEERVRSLSVGDREALLLHVRRSTLGERIPCVLACPACAEAIDVELLVSDLLVPPYDRWPEWHELDLGSGTAVRFRLPTGADQEAAAPVALDDPAAAARLVLERCVDGPVGSAAAVLPEALARLDPQAEIVLELACPACAERFTALFDTGDYLCRELLARQGALFHEVHALARAYHWNEGEILALTPARRRVYLDLLAEERARSGAA